MHGHLPWYRAGEYYEGIHGSWKGTWSMDGGGSLMNQGVHTVDLLQWFAGKVESVFGQFGIFAHDIEAEDQAAAVLRFASGALGTLYTTTCCYPRIRPADHSLRGPGIDREGGGDAGELENGRRLRRLR